MFSAFVVSTVLCLSSVRFPITGIRVKYDLSQPGGSRVVSMMIRCSECLVPQYEPIDLDQVYKVIMPSFTAAGGDGYTMIMEEMLEHHIFGMLIVTSNLMKYKITVLQKKTLKIA